MIFDEDHTFISRFERRILLALMYAPKPKKAFGWRAGRRWRKRRHKAKRAGDRILASMGTFTGILT